jgi:4-hydroxybenzoate polyprenyltransferase
MIKRWFIYFREMYPIISRLFVGYTLFFQIYFLVLLTSQHSIFDLGISEFVGGFTVFGFLLFLRIADDFKDYETDSILFPERALPSGRVRKEDLRILLAIDIALMVILNLLFMNNLYFFLFLMGYGTLMSVWFFSRTKIQKSLPLALVTHNPIQLIINIYIISFACIKYNIPILTYANVLILFSLYFDGLVWEIGRKVKAPEDETEYVTYSKLFGYKKPVIMILVVMFIDFITSSLLVMQLFSWAIIGKILAYLWLVWRGVLFIKNPKSFKMIKTMEQYLTITELYIVSVMILYFITRVL